MTLRPFRTKIVRRTRWMLAKPYMRWDMRPHRVIGRIYFPPWASHWRNVPRKRAKFIFDWGRRFT